MTALAPRSLYTGRKTVCLPVHEGTVNPLLLPGGWGAYLFQTHLRWGVGGGLNWERGLFNLEKIMVSVVHKDLQYKLEKLKYKKVGAMQPRITIKSELPVDR